MSSKRAPTRSTKSRRNRRRPTPRRSLAPYREIIGLILLVLGGLLIVDLFVWQSAASSVLHQLLGWGAWSIPVVLLVISLALLAERSLARLVQTRRLSNQVGVQALVGLALLLLATLGLTHLWSGSADPLAQAIAGRGGGLAGWLVGSLPAKLLGNLIASLLLVSLLAAGIWLVARSLGVFTVQRRDLAGLHPAALLARWRRKAGDSATDRPTPLAKPAPQRPRRPPASPSTGPAASAARTEAVPKSTPASKPAAPRPKRPRSAAHPTPAALEPKPRPAYLPALDLLLPEKASAAATADIERKKEVIERTLASFSVPAKVVDVNVGPTVTQFGVEPGYVSGRGPDGQPVQRRVRVSRIRSLANDLALALEAPSLRIEAPAPGKGYVGIEVPNSAANLVTLRGVLESPALQRLGSPLALALGRDVAGEPVAADLAKMPHLLVAGATGSGKSVCINAIVASLLFNNGPDRLRLLLVDPKRVELPIYNGVPHLAAPVVADVDQVKGALTWLTLQMDERYRAFARVGARRLVDFNHKVGQKRLPAAWSDLAPLPYLVLVIDELADLMMAASEAIEHGICRLAQMGRATGIHLVIATQRPSVDVVTGLIKANFPARIAFAVTSQTDSRVIIDAPGADKLLGRGDMLFMRPDTSQIARLQGCFISDREIGALVKFWRESMPAEELPPNAPRYPWTGLLAQMEGQDAAYERALDLLAGQERISASWLQRRLQISFNRAAELMARLEDEGYVGPDEGAGRGREVLLEQDDDTGIDLFA